MRTLMAAVVLAVFPLTTAAAVRHLVPDHDAPGFARACEADLATARKAIATMAARTAPGAIFDEWNRLAIALDDITGPASLLINVHPDKAVRDAGEACLRQLAALNAELFQNQRLFHRVDAARPEAAQQEKLKRDLLASFEDSGVSLPPRQRERAREIAARLTELDQAFQRNVRDDPTRVVFRPGELEGLPEAWRQSHESSRDNDGNYVLTLKSPSYVPFMNNARNESARKRYFVARESKGGNANLDILYEMARLRQELARLHGLPSFASYALRRRMAGDPERVLAFLADVGTAVTALERREIEELRAAKAQETGRPLGETRLEHWDLAYYQERIRRERFAIDQERLRSYFPTDRAVEFALLVAQTLFGVSFREVAVPAWHPDVRYFDVLDAASGRRISGIYLDLFPREGKYGGGVAMQVRGASRVERRTALCALVANFSRDGLTHNQLTVLMHEFGHVLHCALSDVDYVVHAGLNVKIDFVEAPSRMLEEWARRAQPLGLFRKVCPDCPQLTREQILGLQAAQRYGRGIGNAREWLLSVYDMALSTSPEPPLEVWKRLEAATPLGHVQGTMFPASFGHISSGMTAGYYAYLWSEALALEMLAPFGPDMLDPDIGARFRASVLSQGAQREEIDLVRDFLGREPTRAMLFEELANQQ